MDGAAQTCRKKARASVGEMMRAARRPAKSQSLSSAAATRPPEVVLPSRHSCKVCLIYIDCLPKGHSAHAHVKVCVFWRPKPKPNVSHLPPVFLDLGRRERADDVAIAGVDNAHNAGSEELAACGAELDVVPGEMVDVGLGQHRIILDLGLAEGRAVVGNNDQLRLPISEGLQSLLVPKVVLSCNQRGTTLP